MDRAPRDRVRALAQRVFQPGGNFLGGAIGERDGANAVRIDAAGDEVLDSGDEAEGLAGAGTRDDEDRAHRRFDGAALVGKGGERHDIYDNAVRGTWYVVRGTWYVVRGAWYLVAVPTHDARRTTHDLEEHHRHQNKQR